MNAFFSLGPYQSVIDRSFAGMIEDRVPARLQEKDYTLWKPSPTEIVNRLGWLQSPTKMIGRLAQIQGLVESVRRDGYTHVLLLGMGGSSLAPEVFRKTFGVAEGHPDLTVLDSTDPAAVLACSRNLDPEKTLYVVSSKSGGTVETFSFMKYFFNRVSERTGVMEAGRHFVVITDPGSALEELATLHGFRAIFLNDPDIGGRYSALSCFGLLPAALCGVDVERLLARAAEAVAAFERSLDTSSDGASPAFFSGLYLGAVLGELARAGRDKLTFVFPREIESFGDWLEQLIAESTGKEGRGILPVVGEPLGLPGSYGPARLFVCFRLAGDGAPDENITRLEQAGHPVVRIVLQDLYDLGSQIFLWETATAVACHLLGVNPFDQPDVEASKILARQLLARYRDEGGLPGESPILNENGIEVYGTLKAQNLGDVLNIFLDSASPDSYVALHAYLQPTPETDAALQRLRVRLRDRCRLAITTGYGPRFLHSTGQLHKGGSSKGLFIQITADDGCDAPIPDEMGRPDTSMTFGVLKAAQAMGDRQALRSAGRKAIRFHLGKDIAAGLRRLREAV